MPLEVVDCAGNCVYDIFQYSLARQQLIILQLRKMLSNEVIKPVQTFKAYAALLPTLIKMVQATSRESFAA